MMAAAQGPTLIIVRSSTRHTFGGFANASWTSGQGGQGLFGACIHAPGSFLFTVKNPWGDAPEAFDCCSDGGAMTGNASWGPCFGGDIGISDAGAACHSFFPSSYSDTLGRGKHAFTGAFAPKKRNPKP